MIMYTQEAWRHENGAYAQELAQWIEQGFPRRAKPVEAPLCAVTTPRSASDHIKKLEQNLSRKEKTLVEMATILMLSKVHDSLRATLNKPRPKSTELR